MRQLPPSSASGRLVQYGPVLLGASAFAVSDVVTKVALRDGADVLTTSLGRGIISVIMLLGWLALTRRRPADFSPRQRWIASAIGVVFAGNVFLLFKAIEMIEVPIAILTYFVYPLITGIVAAATGLDRLTWRGVVAAVVALLGLALMIGAHPSTVAASGIVAALGAAGCRVVMLLLTRARLQGADALLITWYSILSSTALFAGAALVLLNWQPPVTVPGWISLLLLGPATTIGILAMFVSTMRIGPFRTAVFMNLEPPLAAAGSALLLGEVLTPLQMLGGTVMIAALVAFQWRR